jgi:DNA-binding transcriptional MerR regulator
MGKSDNQGIENLGNNLLTIKEVAAIIEETPNVVRNWIKELKQHIPLQKNDAGYNVFDEKALERMKLIKQLHREQNYSIRQIEHYFSTDGASFKPTPNKDTGELLAEELRELREEIKILRDYAQRQEEFNKVLVTKLQEQQTYLDKKLDKRDQDLMRLIRDTQETKKLMAATEQQKNSLFGWFRRKK